MSLTLEQRILRYAKDLDDAVEERRAASDEAGRSHEPVPVAETRSHPAARGRGTLVVAATCVVLTIGAAVAILHGRRESRKAVAPATGADWLIPNEIGGYHLWFAQSLQTGVSYPERYRMQLARPTDNGGFTDPVTVTIGDSVNRLAGDNDPSVTRTTMEVRGLTAEIVEGSSSGRTVLQYRLVNGDAVLFVDNADPVGDDTRALLQRFAQAITPTDDGSSLAVTGNLPANYQVLAAMNMQQEFGAATDLTFVDNDTRKSLLFIDTETSTPPGYELFRITSAVEPVRVRGVMGLITTSTDTPAESVPQIGGTVFNTNESTVLSWREPTGQLISINSTGTPDAPHKLTNDALVAIANGLQPVTESQWQTFAQTAESTGPGVGAAVGPTQVSFPTPPAGYQLAFAHLDEAAEIYGQARYVSQDDPAHQPVIDVLLRRWSPPPGKRTLMATFAAADVASQTDEGSSTPAPDYRPTILTTMLMPSPCNGSPMSSSKSSFIRPTTPCSTADTTTKDLHNSPTASTVSTSSPPAQSTKYRVRSRWAGRKQPSRSTAKSVHR